MNENHRARLQAGVTAWNAWRKDEYWFTAVDLSEAWFRGDLSGIDLRDANLTGSDFRGVVLRNADLRDANLLGARWDEADLLGCDLRGARIESASLRKANLEGAQLGIADNSDKLLKRAQAYRKKEPTTATSLRNSCLVGANLDRIDAERLCGELANFAGATFRGARMPQASLRGANLNSVDCISTNLRGANLDFASLVGANFTKADLSESSVFGASAWDIVMTDALQENIRITPEGSSPIVADNVEVAQFMYLLLNNRNIRDFVDTISTKVILILGRFTPERKAVLERIRRFVRSAGFIPVLADFDQPATRDMNETVSTIAHLARLVIADITDAKAVGQELALIVPGLPSVTVLPLCAKGQTEYSMFDPFRRYAWVLPLFSYGSATELEGKLKQVLADLEPANRADCSRVAEPI